MSKKKEEKIPLLTLHDININNKEINNKNTIKLCMPSNEINKINLKVDNKNTNLSLNECKYIFQLAIPVMLTYILEFSPGLISIILLGHVDIHLSKEYIDSAALAVTFLNVSGLSIGFGLATAMDTLCSQAYGANELRKLGLYFQTGVIALGLAFIPIFFINFYSTNILLYLGQPPIVAKLAGHFTIYMLPGIPFLFLYELLKKSLQGQNIVIPMLIVAFIANLINLIFGYYLVYYTNFGYLGAAIARTICNISFPLLLVPCILLYHPNIIKESWPGCQIRVAFKELFSFIILGIPGMLMMMFEWCSFETIMLLAGRLPNPEISIGANAILVNLVAFTYMIYLGISVAGNVRIGNALGAEKPHNAQIISKLSILLAIIFSFINAMIMYSTRNIYPYIFTNDKDVIQLTSKLIQVGALFQIFDGINAAIQGNLRGCGRQTIGAILNFIAYLMIGLPFGYVLAFMYKLGVIGLWWGMVGALFFASSTGLIIIFYFTDWQRMVQMALDRVVNDKETAEISEKNLKYNK